MILKILALVFITTLLRSFLTVGLKAKERKHHDLFKTWTASDQTAGLLQQQEFNNRESILDAGKKATEPKRTLFRYRKRRETANNETDLVEQLALSSGIGEIKRPSANVRRKERTMVFQSGKHNDTNVLSRLKKGKKGILEEGKTDATQKRTSIALPTTVRSAGAGLPKHPVRVTPAFLTALQMLLDERNHFKKDANALTLAKVLLDNGSVDKEKNAALANMMDRFFPTFAAKKLRPTNASLTHGSMSGERKSTIHTELINPTELGVSILRLLFGHKAPLVMKSRNKAIMDHASSRVPHPTVSSRGMRTGLHNKQFATGDPKPFRVVHNKKHRKKTFSLALAKAVSDIIKSMAKDELDNYMPKLNHDGPEPPKHLALQKVPSRFWPSKKKVDVRGNRKSWVLLKIPKIGEPDVIHQKAEADKHPIEKESDLEQELEVEKEHDEDKETAKAGLVDTLGKLNEGEAGSPDMSAKNMDDALIGGLLKNGIRNISQAILSDSPAEPTPRIGYSVRILPSLRGKYGKQIVNDHIIVKPTKKTQTDSTTKNAATFAEAVKKLLQAVQSSIKTIQDKHLLGPSGPTHKPVDPVPKAKSYMSTDNGSVRGIDSNEPPTSVGIGSNEPPTSVGIDHNESPTSVGQSYLKTPSIGQMEEQKVPSLGELTGLTRATGQEGSPNHGNPLFDSLKNFQTSPIEQISKLISPTKPKPTRQVESSHQANVLFDPSKDLESSPSEPITKPSSPTGAKPSPSENVLFESNTELGIPRDRQESSTIKHLKEDLETFAEKGLQAHNRLRLEHHSSALRWSDKLATEAEKLAYNMAMRGIVERSEALGLGFGENVAKITGVSFNDAGSVATDVWYSESNNYSYSYPRLTPQTDAFTQVVWRGTKEIGMGCAKDVATNDLYVVALYKPPGNDRRFLRTNVVNKGTMTEDVYATIFKRTQMRSM